MMRKLLFTLMLFVIAKICLAQTAFNGDYRSVATGNWSSPTNWQIRSAGTWAPATVVPTASNNVYVQSGHTITVDVANAYCLDLQINILGVLAIGTNIMNVNGKIRAYSGTADITTSDGSYVGTSSTAPASSMITTSGVGVLKFVGGTRNITNAGEWNSSGTNNAAEFALDNGAIGTLNTVGVKFNPIVFSSGTVTTDAFISVSSGNLTIKSGAKLISSRNSNSNTTTNIIGNSSSIPAGTVTIDEGGILELTESTPRISCNTFVNNGTVIYSRAGSQTLLQLATVSGTNGTATFNNYSTLIFANTSAKTLSTATTVSKLLQFTGTASLGTTSAILTLTMANNSKIDRSVTSGTSISTSDAAFVFYGSLSTDIVNVDIGTTISASNEVPASPAPGKVGTLTIANGVTYTFTGGRSVTNLVNNGVIALTPVTTMTFTIGGTASGTGVITSNLSTGNVAANSIPEYYSASLAFTNSGSKGTIYLDPLKKELRNLTLTGAGSLTLGNSTDLNNNLSLSGGVLNIDPLKALNILSPGTISGGSSTSYINTKTSGSNVGLLNVYNISAVTNIPLGTANNYLPVTLTPVSSSDFSINVFEGATANATPNGTALSAGQKTDIVDAVYNINRTSGSGNCDVTLGWQSALEGSNFSSFLDNQIGISQYVSGAYNTFTGSGNNTANTATITVSSFAPFLIGKLATTLPVKLISFAAQKQSSSVQLKWATSSEQNNSHFDIERSTDGKVFSSIGRRSGAGNSNVAIDYSFSDYNPAAGINYYRLNQVDLDGKSTLSNPIVVNMGFEGLAMQVFTSANASELKINITTDQDSKGQFIVYSVSGQKIVEQSLTLTKGYNDFSFSMTDFGSGVYIATYKNGTQIVNRKFVK